MIRIGQALKVATKTVARDLAGYRVRESANPKLFTTQARWRPSSPRAAEADLPVSGPRCLPTVHPATITNRLCMPIATQVGRARARSFQRPPRSRPHRSPTHQRSLAALPGGLDGARFRDRLNSPVQARCGSKDRFEICRATCGALSKDYRRVAWPPTLPPARLHRVRQQGRHSGRHR
jgi:hypothetical protein